MTTTTETARITRGLSFFTTTNQVVIMPQKITIQRAISLDEAREITVAFLEEMARRMEAKP